MQVKVCVDVTHLLHSWTSVLCWCLTDNTGSAGELFPDFGGLSVGVSASTQRPGLSAFVPCSSRRRHWGWELWYAAVEQCWHFLVLLGEMLIWLFMNVQMMRNLLQFYCQSTQQRLSQCRQQNQVLRHYSWRSYRNSTHLGKIHVKAFVVISHDFAITSVHRFCSHFTH